MSVVDYLRNSEQAIYDFNTPWSMAIVVLGFLSAWLVTNILEHLGLTRHVWHLPRENTQNESDSSHYLWR